MVVRVKILVAMAVLTLAPMLSAQEKGLANTPPMGWNSWNNFGCNVSEDME
jgi:alpha-galactosidase